MVGADKPELSAGAKTYLQEWYAGEREDIYSKYMHKGNLCEDECIELMTDVLGLGIATKNQTTFENEWIIGTPDVIAGGIVYDTKCSWDRKTLINSAITLNKDYEWQLRGYMWLTNSEQAVLFYGLLDTPEECNYGKFVSYSHIAISERWAAYRFTRDKAIEEQIVKQVVKCREYLVGYDEMVKGRLGKVV